MNEWPAHAREELERLLAEYHTRLIGTGVDADEVVADLRRHVETELMRDGRPGSPATPEEVRQILLPMLDSGADRSEPWTAPTAGGVMTQPAPVRVAHEPSEDAASVRLRRGILHWIFLVFLPAAALLFELGTRMCATEFFDPLAGMPQVFAVAFVPVVFAGILISSRKSAWLRHLAWFRSAAALACGICAYYVVEFAPMTPFASIGIIFFGLGLLPLAPLGAFLISFDLLGQLRRLQQGTQTRPVPAVWPLIGVGFALLVVINLSALCGSLGMRWHASRDAETRARGLALLRSRFVEAVDIDQPWRLSGPASGTDVILQHMTGESGRLWGNDLEHARFAATGRARDLADPELWRRSRGRGRAGAGAWSILGDLSLDGSRLDGSLDPDHLFGYAEWTMILRNRERWPLEGRATLQLPPGGVVSRVTLWIDGEEREAAFAGRSVATKAYESVAVVQRRDPILVTTAGPDRIRLRCFPVPADGQMKFRIGITFPLQPSTDGTRAGVTLPSILEANFAVPADFSHHVWIGGTGGDQNRHDAPDTQVLRGPWENSRLGREPIWVGRTRGESRAVVRGIRKGDMLLQEVRVLEAEPRRVVLVVDGNPRVLRESGQMLLDSLAAEGGGPLDVWVAVDQPVHRSFATESAARDFLARVVAWGEVDRDGRRISIPHRGGFDNGSALAQAIAAVRQDAAMVIWIHGPQIAPAGAGEAVRQALERTHGRVELLETALLPGKNDVLDGLDGRPEVRSLGAVGVPGIRRELDRARGRPTVTVVRARSELYAGDSEGNGAELASHPARLWAAQEVGRLAAAGPARQAEALELAMRYQLVTPVSGAVVLETQAQYDAHGLQPVDPASVPSVPEHGSILVTLLAIAALVAARLIVGRRWRVSS